MRCTRRLRRRSQGLRRGQIRDFRLPVDRAFSVQGFGTVVTGTVISGDVRVRDALSLLPSGKGVRVRGVQTHGRDVDVAQVGARAAVNISGIEVDEVSRGDLLAQPGILRRRI